MVRMAHTVEITSPPEVVWSILSEPTFIPKLYRDCVTLALDPYGRIEEGQRCKMLWKVDRSVLEVHTLVKRVVKERLIESVVAPGGIFRSWFHSVSLKPDAWATNATVVFEYELESDRLARNLDTTVVDKAVVGNLKSYFHNLKEICELIPLPE